MKFYLILQFIMVLNNQVTTNVTYHMVNQIVVVE